MNSKLIDLENRLKALEEKIKANPPLIEVIVGDDLVDDDLLETLYVAGEEAVRQAHAHKDEITGAINWGDLHCVNTEYAIDRGGVVVYRVYIEEAAPYENDLITFVLHYLKENGFDELTLEVVTEW